MDTILDDYNLWGRELEFGVDRLFAYPQIAELLHRREIQVITGIRRCGKTTLLRQCMRHLADSGVDRDHILFVPCDNPQLELESIGSLHRLIEGFRKGRPRRVYVFLDEVQSVGGWERYLKSAYDSNADIKFVISGSTASFFARDVASLLTGRHFYHRIETLVYKEFLRLSPDGTLREYLEWGGFPEVVKAKTLVQKKALLESYLSTIIERDIVGRNDIRDRRKLGDFLRSLLLTVGGKVNLTRLSRQFVIGRRSVERYISLAEDAFLFQEVPLFSYSRRKNRHMLPKLYPADIGFTRLLSGRFEPGRSAEWAVAHLLRDVSYWSDGAHEVDVVTADIAIQVTAAEGVPERESAALRAFARKHRQKQVVLGQRATDGTASLEEFLRQ